MALRVVLEKVVKVIGYIQKVFMVLCGVMFMAMLFLGTGDVFGRYLFNKPITGTQRRRQQVRVDLFISRFSPRTQAIADFAVLLLSLILFAVITQQSAILAALYWEEGRIFQTLKFPTAPFYCFVPVGAFLLCLELIIQIFEAIPKMRRSH
jgi:TRAP-type C4-dicarboxylate transport system permease small subunit